MPSLMTKFLSCLITISFPVKNFSPYQFHALPCFRHNFWTKTFISPIFTTYTPPLAIHGWKATDLSFNLAPSYRDLKDPTSRQNFEDTPGQIPKLILTLRLINYFRTQNPRNPQDLVSSTPIS